MIRVIGRNKIEESISSPCVVRELYSMFKINPDEYVVLVNGDPVTDDEIIKPDDNVVLLEVFSGG
ncbi:MULTISPECIES: MoaD/ThiS family protein [Acidiplasma]|jgi:sulfur carrier protein ThiS|uniref:Thiamine biosynthesis protein ThiS n=1 Tax=Acidiplasma cupricumulans TaxID=312540 RepID=A0A0Q0RZ93_9ARCH|nr:MULTISPECIES: MoaD/ThiS family protein [Acidiplasma]KQB35865.1 hypothetical protein AOG55_05595 [Acidiplasma cupricumulans]WMT54411.1 MAG: MoaD/ThiS family protein [Acidiplasma sp.]